MKTAIQYTEEFTSEISAQEILGFLKTQETYLCGKVSNRVSDWRESGFTVQALFSSESINIPLADGMRLVQVPDSFLAGCA